MELVLDTMRRRYVGVETERFLVRVSEREKPALRRFYGPYFDLSYDLLTKKYGYVPEGSTEAAGRVTIEMFDDSSDFSARTFGYVYPGFLGVCFGPLVTLNGPRALPANVNSWFRTFHHEFAHSITVGLAKGRMPRWLTEGLSTYEEFSFEPSWTRGLDRELYDAWATDDLCRVADFDRHFRGERVVFAYFQAGEVAAMLVRRFGMERIVALLRAYGDDLGTAAAFRKALGISPEDVDRLFREETATRFANVKADPRYSAEATERLDAAWRKNRNDRETAVRRTLALAGRRRFADAEAALAECVRQGIDDVRLERLRAMNLFRSGKVAEAEAARAALEAKDATEFALEYAAATAALKAKKLEAAEARLRSAIAAFPSYPGDQQGGPEGVAPRLLLFKLLKERGRKDEAMAVAEEHLRFRSEDLEIRKEVVAWRLSREEKAAARRHLDLHVLIDARDPAVHADRARLQLEAGEFDGALASAETALLVVEGDDDAVATRADLRVQAAEALLALGRAEEARTMLRVALGEAPSHAAAKRLFEKAEAAVERPASSPIEEKGRAK
jgi:tetratricopeptide (TPR) repeat protein